MPAPSLRADCLALAPESCCNGRTWPSTAKRGCLAWQLKEKGMPQGCPNLCCWHCSLGRAHCLELAEGSQSSVLLSPNHSSICHKEQLMDNEKKEVILFFFPKLGRLSNIQLKFPLWKRKGTSRN